MEVADIGNACLNAPTNEKIVITCGLEFGAQFEGRLAKTAMAQHGLKGSGQAWRSHLAKVLLDDENLEFHMCKADNDVWYRPATKPDGTKCYEHILVHTDDILCLSMNPKSILDYLDQRFLLKPEPRGQPKTYLGADIAPYSHSHEPDVYHWSMGSHTCVKEAVRNVETHLEGLGLALKKKVSTVLPHEYKPELDVSKECNEEEVSQHHQILVANKFCSDYPRYPTQFESAPNERCYNCYLPLLWPIWPHLQVLSPKGYDCQE